MVTAEELMSTAEVSRVLEVVPDTVRLYGRTGILPALRLASGQRLYRRADVEALAHARAKSGA